MNKSDAGIKTTFIISLCLILSLTGCIAELGLLEESELVAVRGVAAEELEAGELAMEDRLVAGELAETRVGESLSRAERMGITAEDINIFTRSTAEIRAGRLITADEVAFNSELGKIKIVRSFGENPRLFVKGAKEPFAEVLPKEGKIRLFNNKTISLHNNIYSVEGKTVTVRYNPYISSNNIVATLHQGDMVVKLAEDNGWFQVKIVQRGAEYTGYINASLLAAVIVASNSNDKKESPQEAISDEEKQRWNYYWAAIGGNNVPTYTAQDAMNILYDEFGKSKFKRRISYNINDWRVDIDLFLKMDCENIPILSEDNFEDKNLQVLGFTKSGEILQYIEFKNEGVKINNPLDWGPRNYGEWYKVKTLNGEYGWVFTRPYGQNYSYGTLVKRCKPGAIKITSVSSDSYGIYINGKLSFDLKGNTYKYLANIPTGVYTIRVLQLNGYFIYPTDKTFNVNVTCGGTVSVIFP